MTLPGTTARIDRREAPRSEAGCRWKRRRKNSNSIRSTRLTPGLTRGAPRVARRVALVFFLGAACGGPKVPDPVTEPIFLVSPQRRQQLQGRLLAALAENARRRCPRPVLRGPPHPGKADGAVIAVVEPQGSLAACDAAVHRHEAGLRAALFESSSLRAGVALPTPRRLLPAGKLDPKTGPVMRACAALPDALERAIRHREVCSPYLPGRRRLPDFRPLIRLSLGVSALASWRARVSTLQGVWLVLSALRFHQDLCRGGAAWVWPVVTAVAGDLLVSTLSGLLSTGRLSQVALREIDRALLTLLQSEPPLRDHLRGEQLYTELSGYLIPLMPKEWTPPGGRPLGTAPSSLASARRPGSVFENQRQGLLLAWLASQRHAERLSAVCPKEAAPWRCLAGIRRLERWNLRRRVELRLRFEQFEQRLMSGLGGHFDRRAIREAAIELLAGLADPTVSGYFVRAARRAFYLAALRVHVGVLERLAGRGPAPIFGARERSRLAGVLLQAKWGGPLRIWGGDGEIVVAPRIPLSGDNEPPIQYVIRWLEPDSHPAARARPRW